METGSSRLSFVVQDFQEICYSSLGSMNVVIIDCGNVFYLAGVSNISNPSSCQYQTAVARELIATSKDETNIFYPRKRVYDRTDQ